MGVDLFGLFVFGVLLLLRLIIRFLLVRFGVIGVLLRLRREDVYFLLGLLGELVSKLQGLHISGDG